MKIFFYSKPLLTFLNLNQKLTKTNPTGIKGHLQSKYLQNYK